MGDALGMWHRSPVITGDASGGDIEFQFHWADELHNQFLYTADGITFHTDQVADPGFVTLTLFTHWPPFDQNPTFRSLADPVFDGDRWEIPDLQNFLTPTLRSLLIFPDGDQIAGTADTRIADVRVENNVNLGEVHCYMWGRFYDRRVTSSPDFADLLRK